MAPHLPRETLTFYLETKRNLRMFHEQEAKGASENRWEVWRGKAYRRFWATRKTRSGSRLS